DRMHARVEAAPTVIERRKTLTEHPFGTIKVAMNQRAFLMRGLEKVRCEFSLSTLAYNILRAVNIVGVEKLIEASRQRAKSGKKSCLGSIGANTICSYLLCALGCKGVSRHAIHSSVLSHPTLIECS